MRPFHCGDSRKDIEMTGGRDAFNYDGRISLGECSANGSRTRVFALRGRRPRPLDDSAVIDEKFEF